MAPSLHTYIQVVNPIACITIKASAMLDGRFERCTRPVFPRPPTVRFSKTPAETSRFAAFLALSAGFLPV
jgi:hypothetical protein